ncbi:MAG: ABC transporter permease [Spirochaetales bacterium]|nr:ABC transporter permease [Spirochaetales bacterium]
MNNILKKPALLIVILTIVPTVILVFILSKDPIYSLYVFFTGPFSNKFNFGNMLNRTSPLILTSLGAFIALKSNSFNLGGEGQVYLGATVTGLILTNTAFIPSSLSLLLTIVIVLLTTGFVTFVSSILEEKYNVNSLISTYLISMILIYICDYFVTNLFLLENSNILTTKPIPEIFELKSLLPPSSLSSGFIIAVTIVIMFSFLLKNTVWGYEFTISGRNNAFSKSMGINNKKYKILGLTISGALHGLAGYILVTGSYHSVISGFYMNLGWNGLSSALVAGSRPIMILISSLFFSYLDSGASSATVLSDVTIELSTIIKSVIFFVISSKLIKDSLIKKGNKT